MLAPALKRLDVHAAREQDLAAALALLEWEQQKNPYVARTPDVLVDAVRNRASEYRACVAIRDGELVGLAVYGYVAGAIRTASLHGVLVAPRSRRAGIGLRLLQHIAAELSQEHGRMIVAEIPGDPYLMRYRALLLSNGFMEETRIEDYYRDGIPQIISRLDL